MDPVRNPHEYDEDALIFNISEAIINDDEWNERRLDEQWELDNDSRSS